MSGRITIFNNQDAVLSEAQHTIAVALNGMAVAMEDMPLSVMPHVIAVMAQLAACSETIGDLREATAELNKAAKRLERTSVLRGLDEAELGRLRMEAHKAGHHGSLSDFVAKREGAA
jgi:hypothetical protein